MNKLLIVDDSSTMRRIMLRVLRQADIAVESFLEAASGEEGLECLASHPDIGLILSDVNMPTMDGIDFVRAVRARHPKENLPVILVTTEAGERRMPTALHEGANGFVTKPFTPETIKRALEPYVGESHGPHVG